MVYRVVAMAAFGFALARLVADGAAPADGIAAITDRATPHMIAATRPRWRRW
jgi:hypothetical protein